MTKVKISVLIPTFNRALYLAECLDSIFSQTIFPYQVIVVNDGSNDNTKEVLSPYMHRIDYIETDQLGKPEAINHGLKRVAGDYLWIFDDDDVALPEALERFVKPLEKYPQYGFSYSTFYYTHSQATGFRIGKIRGESRIPDFTGKGFLLPLLESNFLGGAALFARTGCYKTVGDFDPALLRSQDYEMAIRIIRRFQGVRVPGGPTFHYRQHSGLRGSLQNRFEETRRNWNWLKYDQIIFRKLYRELPLCEYLPPGYSVEENVRQALLQRIEISALKLLAPEVMNDLDLLTSVSGNEIFSPQEKKIVHSFVKTVPYYQEGHIFDMKGILHTINCLSGSKNIRLLRKEVVRNLTGVCLKTFGSPGISEGLRWIRKLYVKSL